MRTTVWVTHRFTGFHMWPDAPPERDYLGVWHRHLFHVRVEVDVHHDDREVEFHDLLDIVKIACERFEQAGGLSCESMARAIRENVLEVFGSDRIVSADVSEDGECGARVSPY